MTQAITVSTTQALSSAPPASVFSSIEAFESAQRMAMALSKSDLVPDQYRGNIANALIALEVANRIGASPLMVMQNLHVINGRPSWSSSFIIAALNSCGRYAPLKFVLEGEGDNRSCYAWTNDRDGERLQGTTVTMKMAHAEGWSTKKGSKWQTMPELMLRYRAAAFFGRMYAPEILMGMYSTDEQRDIGKKGRPAPIPDTVEDEGRIIDVVAGEVLHDMDDTDEMMAILHDATPITEELPT